MIEFFLLSPEFLNHVLLVFSVRIEFSGFEEAFFLSAREFSHEDRIHLFVEVLASAQVLQDLLLQKYPQLVELVLGKNAATCQ